MKVLPLRSPIVVGGANSDIHQAAPIMKTNLSVRTGLITMPVVFIVYLFLAPFVDMGYLHAYKAATNAIHVTDPGDPHFNKETFDARNYAFFDDLMRAITTMFPADTPRSVVDRILVDQAHAQIEEGEDANGVSVNYRFPSRFMPLPVIAIRKPGQGGDWWFRINYTHPKTPSDKNTMLLISFGSVVGD